MIYPDINHVLEIHKLTVRISGGGSDGHLEIGKLESVLQHIQNDDYYPTFEDKLTHLVFSTNKFHCFEDGNKRLSISVGAHFLLSNGNSIVRDDLFRKWRISAITWRRAALTRSYFLTLLYQS